MGRISTMSGIPGLLLPGVFRLSRQRFWRLTASYAIVQAEALPFPWDLDVNVSTVQLNEVVIGVASSLRDMLGPQVGLSTSMARELTKIRADPNRLRDAVLAIAANMRNSMREGGRLIIETSNVTLIEHHSEAHEAQYVQLTMTCSAGNPVPTLRVPPSVNAVIAESGGHISSIGNGTVVNLYFPAAV